MYMAYRYNLMHHIGMVSTVGNHEQDGRAIPQCFDILTSTGILIGERFDMLQCENYSISPCGFLKSFDSSPFQLVVKHRPELNYRQLAKSHEANRWISMLFLVGRPDDSCSDTCANVNSTCSKTLMHYANDCIMLRGAFPCSSCSPSSSSISSWNTRTACPAFEVTSKHCDVCSRSGPMNCDSKHTGFSRLCSCIKTSEALK